MNLGDPAIALWQENQALKQECKELRQQVEALRAMLANAKPTQRLYITRPCGKCGEPALFDPLTEEPALCTDHRFIADHGEGK